MKQWFSLFAMIRVGNAFMASVGTALGYWISSDVVHFPTLAVLMAATIAALGYGNVLNDIVDVKSDAIAHPQRPLVTGVVRSATALRFALLLAILSLGLGFFVSVPTGVAVLVPLALLTLYALYLKGTVLWGNGVVALLVAYTLLFGALGGRYQPLVFPALLAALGNFIREIMKDYADKEGDREAGVVTSAALGKTAEQLIVVSGGLLYLLLLPYPFVRGDFGEPYLLVVFVILFPLHSLWMHFWRVERYGTAARVLKFQMMGGLVAIALDFWWAS